MFSFGKSKRVANIVIDDYVIRMVENNGNDLTSINQVTEKALPPGLIKNGKIIDELAFYNFMKEVVQEWGIKNNDVRFYVPHELIIMRDIALPDDVLHDEIKQYITMEIGNTIHFPFANPVFDIYDHPEENKVTVLAAPEEEIIKYTEVMADANLKPVAVDVQSLGTYRYFLHQYGTPEEEQVHLMLELNLASANISIFHEYRAEFLRYQPLNISTKDWHPSEEIPIQWTFTGDEIRLSGEVEDQLTEIDRIMNFYRFSLHQGEKTVTDIVLFGDFPQLHDVKLRLEERYELPVTLLTIEQLETDHPLTKAFIPALGLAVRGR